MSKSKGSPAPPTSPTVLTRVRYGETDQMGVVYHANYFVYFEMGRTEYLRYAGIAYARLEHQGLLMVVVEAAAQYKAPASYDDEISIATALTSLTHARIRFDYTIKKVQDQSLIATGHTVLACLDKAGKVIRIPDHVNEALMHGDRIKPASTICDRRLAEPPIRK